MTVEFSKFAGFFGSIHTRISLVLFCLLGCLMANAGEPFFSTLDDHRNPHLRVGVSFRKVSVDFSVNPRVSLPFGQMQNLRTGPGDVGLFTAASGNVVYEDGTVGGQVPVNPVGDAFFMANDSLQITPTLPPRTLAGVDVRQVTFTSSEASVTNAVSVQSQGLIISDDEINAAPYVQLVFPIDGLDGDKMDDRFKNFTIGYTYLHSSHGMGPLQIGTQRSTSTATTYSYTYDYWSPVPTPPPGVPAADGGLIFDAASVNGGIDDFTGNFEDPRTASTGASTRQTLRFVSQSKLNLDLHEIPIGFE